MSTRAMTLAFLIMLAIPTLYMALMHNRLPDVVPIHWDLHGNPDDWASKWVGFWVSLGMILFFYLLAVAAPWMSPKAFEVDAWRQTFNYIMVLTGLTGVLIFFMTAQAALDPEFTGPRFIRALASGFLIWMGLLGNVLGKTRKNFWVGIRSPWTLASEEVWIKTHRFAARLLVAVGFMGGVLVWFGLHPLVGLGAMILALFIPAIYSLFLYKRLHPNGAGVILAMLGVAAVGTLGCAAQNVNAATAGQPAFEAEELDVKFAGAGGFELSGTLLLPEGSKKAPAVVLLPGSGPTDRDGNQPPMLTTDLLKQIAEHLAKQGIVTLRFDKRAAAVYAAKWPSEDKFDDFFSWESFGGDAQAAVEFLRKQKGIAPSKVFVAGHSEGAMIAMELGAQMAGDAKPAGLILMAGPGRGLDAVILEQIDAALTTQKAPKEVHEEYMNLTRKAIDQVKQEKRVPTDLPPGLQPLFPAYASKLLYSYFTFDPATRAERFPGPVLIIQGEKDVQVSAERDTKPLMAAYQKREKGDVQLLLLPDTSHNLKLVTQPQDPGFAGPVVEKALERLASWVLEQSR
jgi:uncharacterized protein